MSTPAEQIIDHLGGLTRVAELVSRPVSTVQGWKVRGKIPQEHWVEIIEAAKAKGIELSLNDFVFGLSAATPSGEVAA